MAQCRAQMCGFFFFLLLLFIYLFRWLACEIAAGENRLAKFRDTILASRALDCLQFGKLIAIEASKERTM